MPEITIPMGDGRKTDMWLPTNDAPMYVRDVAKAIEGYDSKLSLGKDKSTDEWVILREGGPIDVPFFPVFGLGRELPSVDTVRRMLYERDVTKNGARIVASVVDAQERRKKAVKDEADAGAEAAASAMRWAIRKDGLRDGVDKKIFIPRGIS